MTQQNAKSLNLGLFSNDNPVLDDEGVGLQNEQSNIVPLENPSTESGAQSRVHRKRVERSFPAVPFEDALELALVIQKFASGQKVRRLRLFDLWQRSPDSGTSRALITNSTRYGLTTGSYKAEWLELTPEGKTATSDDVPEREKIRTRFKLAIEQIPPFKSLYLQFQSNRLPAKGIMADFLREQGLSEGEVSECVDTFLLNAKFVGILQSLSGAERLVTIDHVLDYAPAGVQPTPSKFVTEQATVTTPASENIRASKLALIEDTDGDDGSHICFYITPIGSEGSEQRQHSDLFLGSIIEPALEEFGLTVLRADKIAEAGMITRQVIEHIMRAKLVIADLSFHNPNVFYELALRHATGKATVQLIRARDRIPFDIDQMRTIVIDDSSVYALVPQLEVHRAAIASQVRRALEHPDHADNPVTAFLPILMPNNNQVA